METGSEEHHLHLETLLPPRLAIGLSLFVVFFFGGRSCLQKTAQGRDASLSCQKKKKKSNASMENLGKGASPEEEGR